MTRYINLAPSWAGITPALIEMVRAGREPSATIAREELLRMAALADQLVLIQSDPSSGEPRGESAPRFEIKVKK